MAAITRSRIAVLPAPTCQAAGFSLVELAVVMFIIALLIGGMVMPLSAQQDVRARQETDKLLTDIREALYGFAAVNGRLPRPANSASDGNERALCNTDADCSGFVPWAALGLPRADGWSKLIRYSVTPAFANAAVTIATIPNRTVQSRDDAGTLFYLVGAAACTTASGCAPAVVFSQGKSNWGTSDNGSALADSSGTNVDEDTNNTGPLGFINRFGAQNPGTIGGEFDDQVLWISSNTLFNRLISSGRL